MIRYFPIIKRIIFCPIVDTFICYVCRHTCCSNMAKSGMNPKIFSTCENERKQNGMTCKFWHIYNQEQVDSAVLKMIGNGLQFQRFKKRLLNSFRSYSIAELPARVFVYFAAQLKTMFYDFYQKSEQKLLNLDVENGIYQFVLGRHITIDTKQNIR